MTLNMTTHLSKKSVQSFLNFTNTDDGTRQTTDTREFKPYIMNEQ